MKHQKGILYDDFMFLSKEYRIIESKKNCKFFKISKYVALQNGYYGDFQPILEFMTYNAKCGKTRELFKMIYLHLT